MAPAPQHTLSAAQGKAGREWYLLGAALLSSAALLVAAWFGVGDPQGAGRAELARVASELESSVLHDWELLRRGPWDWSAVQPFQLGNGRPLARASEPSFPQNEDANALFEALLSEARKQAGVEKQLALVAQAMACPVDATRMGRARVLAIGLALEAEDPALAREHWQAARDELQGFEAEAEDGIALWLKAALGIEPILEAGERRALQAEIIAAWQAGSLALPAAIDLELLRSDPAAALSRVMPLRAALCRRVSGLLELDPGAEAWFEARLALDRRLAIEAVLGHGLPVDKSGLATLERISSWELVVETSPEDDSSQRVWVLPGGSLGSKLEQVARDHGVVPAGFQLGFGSPPDGQAGELIRAAIGLEGGPLQLTLYHSDPDSYVSSVQSKRWLMRAGLLLMAFFTAAAGLVSFRALGRERRLAALKSAFVSNVSHELRTPIASILLMAENLELGRVSDEPGRKRYLRLIRQEADRLRRLVRDVLDFSRLERGEGLCIVRAPGSLLDLARLLEEDLRAHVEAAGGELVFAQQGSEALFSADAEALRRATLNLVDNALKHSGTKRVELNITADEELLRIRVRDRGKGVEASRMASIIEPFARIEHPEAVAGTGLGLSIVHEIARAHRGSLRLQAPGEGSGLQVEICIPLHAGEDNTLQPTIGTEPKA